MSEKYLEISFADVIRLVKRRLGLFIIFPALSVVIGGLMINVRDVSYTVEIPYRLGEIPPALSKEQYLMKFEDMFFDTRKFGEYEKEFAQTGIEYSDINMFQNIQNIQFQQSDRKVFFNKDKVDVYIENPQIITGLVKYLNFVSDQLNKDLAGDVSSWNAELNKKLPALSNADTEYLVVSILTNERYIYVNENGGSGLRFLRPVEPKRVGVSNMALLLISFVLGTIFSFIWSILTTNFND